MKISKIVLSLAIATISLSFAIPAYADTKISTVSIKIDSESDSTSSSPDLDISTKSNKYSVGDYEITQTFEEDEDYSNSGPGVGVSYSDDLEKPETTTDNVLTCEISLAAEEGYYFSTMSKNTITVSGFGAECTKVSRQDSGKTLILTVELPEFKAKLGEIENAGWQTTTKAEWSASSNVHIYSVRLLKDGKNVGKVQTTNGNTYDFAPLMQTKGNYHYIVWATKDEEMSDKAQSSISSVTEEEAAKNRAMYQIEYENVDTSDGPATERAILNGGWQQSGNKWWFRNDDGTYPQNNWIKSGEFWYYFDSDGYMVTDKWVSWKGKEYYFGTNGVMFYSETTPDGSVVDASGAKK